ncbi:MAG: glycosyl transferase family protein [Sphingomonas bacterium]|nr:glycosyl transferase family protein [Sphingomonas bacterium]MDB5688426.1 glycosyl transferase family protein [Sphingomonas bacterium]
MADAAYWLLQAAAHELLLFAAVGLLVGGLDDLLVDLIWIGRGIRRVGTLHPRATISTLAAPAAPGRIAVLIGAWDESAVIGSMLRHALATFDHDDYRIYVGTYPNDPATIAAVDKVARHDRRVRLVVGDRLGPTTKADCLNQIWHALLEDEARARVAYKAVVLHDAEDVVHSGELKLFDTLIERFDLVQLPVLPLVDRASRWISGHYCDEFAEAHGKQLVVREAIGAGIPSAGVGCALSRAAIGRIADAGGGDPFDADSLTEDYEIGLKLGDFGMRGIFVRLPAAGGRSLVAVRAYFPATLATAVRQKTRWLTGIALSGWDRLGWSGGIAESWMRLRDRRAVLAALILATAYAALLLELAVLAWDYAFDRPVRVPFGAGLALLLQINLALMVWRVAMRAAMVRQAYGWGEAARSMPRMIVGNIVAMMAARRAVFQYLGIRAQRPAAWDKTGHVFPDAVPAE